MSGRRNHSRGIHLKRRIFSRQVKESFLIICQGENTEPVYFKSFRLISADVRTISYPHHGNVLSFVREAIRFKELNAVYDNYWLVIDKDDNTNTDFNRSIVLAGDAGFNIAYSIQAFEFWFILHFNCHIGPMPRETYSERLSRYLGFEYNKERATCLRICEALKSRQAQAIRNAEIVYERIGDHSNIATEESSTTVHELVNSLNRFV